MRRWKPVIATTAGLALAAGLLTTTAPAATADDAGAEAYTWKNAQIGGGGFVPGFVFNRSEPDLLYARTDIGGAYRWNEPAQEWVPLLDSIGWDDWGYTGVARSPATPSTPTGCTPPWARTPTTGTPRTAPSCAPRTGETPGSTPNSPSNSGATCRAGAWANAWSSTRTTTTSSISAPPAARACGAARTPVSPGRR